MHSRTSTLTALTLLLTACGISDPTTADTAPVDESPDTGAPTEDLTVFVYEPVGDEPVPLEGAVVGLSQDGVVSMLESDAEGRATFDVNPDGGPIMASAYLSNYSATSVVGQGYAALHGLGDVLPLLLEATATDTIRVSGVIERPEPNAMQTVVSSSAGSFSQQGADRFAVSAARGEPFTLTAYQQIVEVEPTPYDGMRFPMLSFRTLEHEGSQRDLDVTNAAWTEHEIADHTLRVTRPTAPAVFAYDWAPITASAVGIDGDASVMVAVTTGLEPWFGKTSNTVTLSGRADLMTSTDLTMWTTIYAADDERSSTIRTQGALPSLVEGPFLGPPEVLSDFPSQADALSWRTGDASLWTLMSARSDAARWLVTVLPGTTSLDLPALLATLPTAPLEGRPLTAVLTSCESDESESACSRSAGGLTFTIGGGAGR